MSRRHPPLKVTNPCPKNWDDMTGDAKRRYCDHCGLHVHNLSEMSDGERSALVASSAARGRTCVAYYERADGTMTVRSRRDWLTRRFGNIRWKLTSRFALLVPLLAAGCATPRQDSMTVGEAPVGGCKTHQEKSAPKPDPNRVTLGY